MINNLKLEKPVNFIYSFLIILLMIFGRNFTGLYLFNFRIGELIIGFLLLSSTLIFIKYCFRLKDLRKKESYLHALFFIILISFIVSLFVNNGSVFSLYTYKASSYIWTLCAIFFVLVIDVKKYLINKNVLLALPIIYFLNAIYFPNFLIEFFNTYSDKFDFQKASDIFIVFVISNLICMEVYKEKFLPIIYLFISFSILNPLFLFMSKGSFFPSILFFLLSLVFYKDQIKKNYRKVLITFLVSFLMFVISTYEVYGNLQFDKDGPSAGEENLISFNTFQDNYKSISENKNTTDIFASIYILNKRIYSTENLLNWRLQIWQDVFYDQIEDKNFLLGYGYNEIIPAMDNPDRRGIDGSNEHVHNYFVNVFARGGFLQFSLFLFFYIYLLKKDNFLLSKVLFFIPILLVSSFDPSMETVRFPIIFFTYMTLFFIKKDSTYI